MIVTGSVIAGSLAVVTAFVCFATDKTGLGIINLALALIDGAIIAVNVLR